MSDAKAQQEPSMEEILASIRRIISEDAEGQKPAAAAQAPAEAPVHMPDPFELDDDVLNLTDKVNDDGSVVSLSQPSAPAMEPMLLDEPAPAMMDMPTMNASAPPVFSLDDHDFGDEEDDKISYDKDDFDQGLMSRAAAAASAAAFADLDALSAPEPEPVRGMATPVSTSMPGNVSLHDFVMQALQPMLSDWLDRHLPSMVEDMVRSEIERVAQSSRRR